jgi:hypothetical protein
MRLTMAISGFPHIMLHWIVLSVCSHTTTGDVNQPEVHSNKPVRRDAQVDESGFNVRRGQLTGVQNAE